MKSSKAISLSVVLLAVTSSYAAFSVQFTVPVFGGIAKNFGDQFSVAQDGLSWGIVVDTAGDGFQAGLYTPSSTASEGFLNVGGVASDDFFSPGTNTPVTSDSTAAIDADFQPGGTGTVGQISGVTHGEIVPGKEVSTGDQIAIIWFITDLATTNNFYGFLTDATFTVPADGATQPLSDFFLGNNTTVRPADLQIAPVPEPTTFGLVAGMLALGLVAYRRRQA